MDPRPIFVVTTQTPFALPTRAGEMRHVRWSLVPETPFEVDRLRQGCCAGM